MATVVERKNYKRIRLAKHLTAALAERFPGQPIEVNPDDFGYPLGAQRTDFRHDIVRWDIFVKVGARTLECNSDYTMTECARWGVIISKQWDGFHLDCFANRPPKTSPEERNVNG